MIKKHSKSLVHALGPALSLIGASHDYGVKACYARMNRWSAGNSDTFLSFNASVKPWEAMVRNPLGGVQDERLRAENERLKLAHSKDLNRLREEVQRLKKANEQLKSENKKLQQRYEHVLKRLEKLEKKQRA